MNESLYPEAPVLLVDDEKQWLNSFAISLEYDESITNVIQCTDSREVLGILARQPVSLVLLDLTMPHIGGEALLPQIAEAYPQVPVIILSGLNQLETAVKCMKLGAFDYFVKTTERERLLTGIRRALEAAELRRENRVLSARILDGGLKKPEIFAEIITRSPKMQAIFRYLEAIAPSSEPFLVTGESGTGKELIARAFHLLSRPDGPFVAVNMAGLDDNVFADTLFGHVRGAFTGAERPRQGILAQAQGGVLFLDEIGDLSLASQVKLLRLLQEKEYLPLGSDTPRHTSARFVFATNCDLSRLEKEGRFRKDLYYRLCTHQVHLPPLRERVEDLPPLIHHFLREACSALQKELPIISDKVYTLLQTCPFPGNIRELRAMLFNAASLSSNGKLPLSVLQKSTDCMAGRQGKITGSVETEFNTLLPALKRLPSLKKAGDSLVADAMRRSAGNQTVAARLLGISQPALHRRVKKDPRLNQ